MYPQGRRRDYKPKMKKTDRQFPSGLPVYVKNLQQCGLIWVASVIVRTVGDVMYKGDARGNR